MSRRPVTLDELIQSILNTVADEINRETWTNEPRRPKRKRRRSVVFRHDTDHLFCESCGGDVVMPEDVFKKLLILCHPDKHGNSETSQEVTRWLLEQRKK